MSANTSAPSVKGVTTGAQPTEHAKLRYLERVDAHEAFPSTRIREIVREGERVNIRGFTLPARVKDGVAVVVDEDAGQAVTVLEASDEQLVDTETDASAGWRAEYRFQGVPPGGHE